MPYQYSGCSGAGVRCQVSDVRGGYGPSRLAFRETGYQGRGDFRGRGILFLMVETLVVRLAVPACQWRFNLWPAVVRALFVSVLFSTVSSSGSQSFFFSVAGFWAARLVRNWRERRRTHLLQKPGCGEKGQAPSLRVHCGIGTGICGGGLCLVENRRLGCDCGLTGGRWLCGLGARRRLGIQHSHLNLHRHPHTHPSGAWVGHPRDYPPELGRTRHPSPRVGCRWGRLRWLPMLAATECRITTGSRGGLLRW
jgi:hypothetical protein